MIQLTKLLYLVLEAVDGRRTHEEIAAEVTRSFGRPVSADNVDTLVDGKLRPLGVLLKGDGSAPELRKSNPLLGLRHRVAVTDPVKTDRLTAPFARLFNPVLVAVIVAVFCYLSWWLLFDKGLASAAHEAFHKPGLLLLIFVVTVLSAGFHEFGHAAAARRGGSTPGVMGMGLYLFWPAFYTDVTDSYRLGRVGRIRTDLGGLYFNAIVAVGIVGVWWATGYDALLLVVATPDPPDGPPAHPADPVRRLPRAGRPHRGPRPLPPDRADPARAAPLALARPRGRPCSSPGPGPW